MVHGTALKWKCMKELTELEVSELDILIEKYIQNPTKFSIAIEGVRKETDLSYMDSIIHYCRENSIELNIVGDLVTANLREKVEAEARNLNFLPKGGVLPI